MLQTMRTLLCAGFLLAYEAAPVWAQPTGQLAGVIRDTTRGVLPGVAVALTGVVGVAARTAITDDQGRYHFGALPRGRYTITAWLAGFRSETGEVDIDDGPATMDLVLGVSSVLETVTVTATKTGAANVQSTPIAVTAVPERTLAQLGVQSVEGLAGLVPTLTISQSTALAQVSIRGIGTNVVLAGSDPSSTIHLDGVYLARPAMVFMDFLNVERVEVLRGPQGTLYGRNSVGGTVNIVTRQPTNTLETSVRLTAGNYDKLRAEAAVSGPIVKDRVMGSLAVIRGTRDGFVKVLNQSGQSLGSEDTWAGRGQLRFVFGTRHELMLSADYARLDGVPLGAYAKPIVAKPGHVFDSPASLWAVRSSEQALGKNTQQGASARLALRMGKTTTLNSLTAYRKSNYRFFVDADGTELKLQTSDVPDVQRQISQELTVVQQLPKLTWIGGAFLFDEQDEGDVRITVFPATEIRPFARIGARAWALFGQATYILSRRVSVTTGVRYTSEQKDLRNSGGVYLIGTDILAVPSSFYAVVDRVTFDAWTPKGSIQMQVSDGTFVYVSAAQGFKSGGFNPTAARPGLGFSPESAWSYEGGMKRTIAGGRAQVNAALFYTDYQDLQVQSFIRPGVPDISNAASAVIRGVEVELALSAWRSVQLAGHFAWLDASYDRYIAAPTVGVARDVAGHALNNAPDWSGGGSAAYEFATARAGWASIRGEVTWRSRVFFTPFNDDVETQGAYGLAQMRAAFEPRSRRWEVAVYVRNAGNQRYITATANVPVPAYTARPGEPRQWGAQFTWRP